jgi:hypothetical protein
VGGGRGDDGDLDAWAAGARAQEAAAARARRRWLRRQAEEQAEFVSLLVELRERAVPIEVVSASGRAYRGRIRVVGRDCVLLSAASRRAVLVSAAAIVAVRPQDDAAVALTVEARPTGPESMAELVRRAAGDRPRVTVHTVGAADPVSGDLVGCGVDVVVVLAGEPPTPTYLRLTSVSEISFDSG